VQHHEITVAYARLPWFACTSTRFSFVVSVLTDMAQSHWSGSPCALCGYDTGCVPGIHTHTEVSFYHNQV